MSIGIGIGVGLSPFRVSTVPSGVTLVTEDGVTRVTEDGVTLVTESIMEPETFIAIAKDVKTMSRRLWDALKWFWRFLIGLFILFLLFAGQSHGQTVATSGLTKHTAIPGATDLVQVTILTAPAGDRTRKSEWSDFTSWLDHNSLLNYVADEHVLHAGVVVTCGIGLTGCGDISTSFTIDVLSTEAGFLTDGGVTGLTCGAGNQGKSQVMDDGRGQFCDGATTSLLRTLVPSALWSGDAIQTTGGAVTVQGVQCTDCVALTTETTGNYVSDVAVSGAGLDISHTPGEGSTATLSFDPTELEIITWGAGISAGWTWTFNTNGTDPVLTIGNGTINVSTGTLQEGGVAVSLPSRTETLTNKSIEASQLNSGTVPVARVGGNHIDTITEIASALRGGADLILMTGTTGATGNCAEWNADGDLIDSGAGCGGGSGDNIFVNGTALVDANFTDSTEIAFVINRTASPDEISPHIVAASITGAKLVTDPTISGANFSGIPSSAILTEIRDIPLDIGAWSADGTQCADATENSIGSWGKKWSVVCTDNDAATITMTVAMPNGWDAGTVTLELYVVQDAADTNALQGDVSGRCVGDGETPAAYGTEVAMDDTMTGSDAVNMLESGAITLAGTCAAGDIVQLQYQMDATGTTTAVATLHFYYAKIEFTSNVGD